MPVRDALVNKEGKVESVWRIWFRGMRDEVTAAPARVAPVKSVNAQSATIGLTPLSVVVSNGWWRISYFARVTVPATTSSSLIPRIGFTQGGVPCVFEGAAMTGNLTTTFQSGSVFVRADADAPFTYGATYASVGATPMQFLMDVSVERVSA